VIGRAGDSAEREAHAMAASARRGTPVQPPQSGLSTGAGEPAPAGVRETLRRPGQPLDAGARQIMERRFGADFGNVRIHRDSAAARSAAEIGSLAYTDGKQIAFGAGQYRPGTEAGRGLIAHELAHVLQARSSASGASVVRRYTAYAPADQEAKLDGKSLGWVHPGGATLRVADSGALAAEDKGWGANLSKRAWATPNKIATANAALKAAGSAVKLAPKAGTLKGKEPVNPAGAAITLTEVEPVRAADGAPLDLASDCGAAAKQVMGSSQPQADVGVLKSGGQERYTAPQIYAGGNPTSAERLSEEIYKMEFGSGLTRAQAYKAYDDLNAAKKDAFDKKYGINRYARPGVGQGITVSTEKDMPGFATTSKFTWNFHYAATVLDSANDYITLENAAGWKPTDWIFYMYGPATKPGQTFHEFHGSTQTHGNKWASIVVQPAKALSAVAKADDVPLLVGGVVTKLAKGTNLTVSLKETIGAEIWLTVSVVDGTHAGKTGKIKSELVTLP
jgi:hypothetical protein